MAIDPGTVGLINTGVSLVSKLLGGGVDTMKHQASCGIMLNSGNVDKLKRASLAPLTTRFRGSVKTKVNGKSTNGRTWQECVMARTIFPKQVTGPMAGPDMIDYMPNVADDRGMIKSTQPEASPYVAANPGTVVASGDRLPAVKDAAVELDLGAGQTISISPVYLLVAALVVVMVMK